MGLEMYFNTTFCYIMQLISFVVIKSVEFNFLYLAVKNTLTVRNSEQESPAYRWKSKV